MGTVFLIDAHTPVLANSEINDTIPLESGSSQVINGSFVVDVPFGVPIDGTPANLTELMTQKFTGLLAFYPGFTYIDYDEGIDASGWDTANCLGGSVGSRGNTFLNSGFFVSRLQSSAVSLTGAAPTVAIVTWEAFTLTNLLTDNDKDGVLLRRYEAADPSDLDVSVSFDNGSNYTTITDGVQFSVPGYAQGTDFIIRISNSSGDRLWVGSWAVIY